MNCKLLIIVLLAFLLNSCSLFLDPGRNKLEEISSEFKSSHIATAEEDSLFKNKYLKELSSKLVAIQHGSGSYYRAGTNEMIAKTSDTLLDVKVNFILNNADKNETIYFITYLAASFVISNDSIKSQIMNQTLMSDAIYVNTYNNKSKIVLAYSTPYSYKHNTIVSDDAIVQQSLNSNVSDIFFDYKYYKRYYKSNKKLNPKFWNHIRHSPKKGELSDKVY